MFIIYVVQYNIDFYQLHKDIKKNRGYGFNLFNWILKRLYIKIVRKGFKYMAYITVLYGGYKKVTKSLIYFSPPAKCFSKYVFFNIFHTILSEPLRQVFSLV